MPRPKWLDSFSFHPVIKLPEQYEVYDFTTGYDPERSMSSEYGIGRYLERRQGMYTSALFAGIRNIHMGIDIAAPVGTPVFAFQGGWIHLTGYNGADGDYGYTLITGHSLGSRTLFALHGHLSARSLEAWSPGDAFEAGAVLAWVGDRHENGGWNPHLHFQLCWDAPEVPDLPGVVAEEDLEAAIARFPDPRWVLGPLY